MVASHDFGIHSLVSMLNDDDDDMQMMMMFDCCLSDADTKAVKTGTIQTQVIDGFQILRSEHSSQTMLHLVEWTKALKRKYDHLMVSASEGHGIAQALLSFCWQHAVVNPYTALQMVVFLLAACCGQSIYSSANGCQSCQYIGLQKAHVESTVSLLHRRQHINDSPESVFGCGDCTSTLLFSWK